MTEHFYLKWNNHSTAFLNSIKNIYYKKKFCDATIVCEGKFFPVHRIILSTCSEYFNEIFERIPAQHPYIVLKDIDPRQMELLLCYMYRGEVNVCQGDIPLLFKAAGALKIMDLAVAVAEDIIFKKDSSCGRKRNNSDSDSSPTKRRLEEDLKKRTSDLSTKDTTLEVNYPECNIDTSSSELGTSQTQVDQIEKLTVKKEPISPNEYVPGDFKSEYFTENLSTDTYVTSFPTNSDVSEDPLLCNNPSPIKTEKSFTLEPYHKQIPGVMFKRLEGDKVEESTRSQSSSKKKKSIALRQCPFCSYVSNNGDHVKRHIMYKHTGERRFTCTICSKRFVEKIQLQHHMRVHTGGKPFKCTICIKTFGWKRSLNNHMKEKHKNDN